MLRSKQQTKIRYLKSNAVFLGPNSVKKQPSHREKYLVPADFPVRLNDELQSGTFNYPGAYYHPESEFQFIRHGKGQYFIHDSTYSLTTNSVIIIHPNEVHAYKPHPSDLSVSKLGLMFATRIVEDRAACVASLAHLQSIHQLILPQKTAVTLELLLRSISDELQHRQEHWRELIVDRLEEFLILLSRASDSSPQSLKKEDPIIQAVIRWIDQNYAEPLGLEEISGRFHVCTATLCRRFKRYAGLGFRQYVIHRRMIEAQRLLEQTDMKVIAIAYEVGFESETAFYRDFRMLTGLTPIAYRFLSRSSSSRTGR
jgi:AraC-like DNA-binding protein